MFSTHELIMGLNLQFSNHKGDFIIGHYLKIQCFSLNYLIIFKNYNLFWDLFLVQLNHLWLNFLP